MCNYIVQGTTLLGHNLDILAQGNEKSVLKYWEIQYWGNEYSLTLGERESCGEESESMRGGQASRAFKWKCLDNIWRGRMWKSITIQSLE